MRLAFIDSNGQVIATQSSPNPPATTKWESEMGYTRVELPDGVPPSRDIKITQVENGVATAFVESTNPVQPVITYAELRRAAYPTIEDQLDMLFHSMEQGDFEFTEWRNAIRAVKEEFPKGK